MKLLQTLLLAGAATQAFGNELLTVDKLENDVTETELRRILSSLNKIGRDNGGNRAFGLPGYNASMDYVLERAVKRFGKHMDTYVQKFTHVFEQTNRIELNEVDKEPVEAVSMRYNIPTALPDGVTGKLVGLPVDDTRGSGCLAEQWDGIDVKGKIVLVKRGQCNIADKVMHAKTRGAKAFILYNNVDGPPVRSSLGLDSQGRVVPSVSTTMALGNEWQKRMATGEEMEVQVVVDTLVENRDSWNIISETKEGDPNNVVMLGAHLDSVQAGPGVNDDGSGTAALLTIMGSIKKYKGFPNKVRFAWWGAEESGLIGSLYYGSKLTTEEADNIRFYFNFDMIGSPAPFYKVYADSEDHKYGGKFLFDHLVKNGKQAEYA
ncbi:hypothetical protein VHEMI02246 [[Torrubiella] hemipterigena]|nr:hypothetical protein VHEMI02246 [[Torrubiella] hemipterigena]